MRQEIFSRVNCLDNQRKSLLYPLYFHMQTYMWLINSHAPRSLEPYKPVLFVLFHLFPLHIFHLPKLYPNSNKLQVFQHGFK